MRIRDTWRFGVASVANAIGNRSDTVAVSLVALSVVTVGVYGVASQVENALTTLALIPAASLIAYSARASHEQKASNHLTVVAIAVAGCYAAIALPFLFFTSELLLLVFGEAVTDVTPIQICVVAGLFSCLGGVAIQHLAGTGAQTAVAVVWCLTAAIGVTLLVVGTMIDGAQGAALGAVIRDVLLCALAWGAILALARRRRERR